MKRYLNYKHSQELLIHLMAWVFLFCLPPMLLDRFDERPDQEEMFRMVEPPLNNINFKNIDLLFLDIQMPDLNGLELSRMLPQDIRIVFTTAFDQYALDSFKVNALDYLLKPINYNEFLSASRKALEWFELKQQANFSREEDFIYVKSDYKLIQIRLEDILYIEGLKDYLKIYTESESRPVLTLGSMKNMEERLPSLRFMRVHRSYIVQMNKVKTLDKGQIVFGKTRITISDTYKTDITAYLNKYLL